MILIHVVELIGIGIRLVLKGRPLLLIDRDQQIISILQRALFFLFELALATDVLVYLLEIRDRLIEFFAGSRPEITPLLSRIGRFAYHFLALPLNVYTG